MAMRPRRADLPLSRDASTRFLPVIMALMVFLAVLALAAAALLADLAGRWQSDLAGAATVELPPPSALSGESRAGAAADEDKAGRARRHQRRVERAAAYLRTRPGTRRVAVLPESRAAELLRPWLGPEMAAADLPLPRLIAVEFAPGLAPDVAAINDTLAELAPGARLTLHESWMAPLRRLARAVRGAALGVIGVTAAVAVAAVAFATGAGLAAHREMVALLHTMGATDRYIARQFQIHALAAGLKGGVAGFVAGALALGLVGRLVAARAGGLLPGLALGAGDWLVLAALPVIGAAIAMTTARWTVLRGLGRLP